MKLTEQLNRHIRPIGLALIPALAAALLAYLLSPAMVHTRYDKIIMFGDSLTQASSQFMPKS